MTLLVRSSLVVYTALAFAAQSLSQEPSPSAQPQSEVSVTVTDSTGRRISGAEVTITALSSGVTLHERTNDKGQAVVKLPKDEYSITATAPGFKWTKVAKVGVQPPEPIHLSLELHPGEKHTDMD